VPCGANYTASLLDRHTTRQAQAVEPPHYQSDPIGTMKTCVNGTANILELGRQKSAHVLQASTSEV